MTDKAFNRIAAGLDDAVSFAKGNTSRGVLHESPASTIARLTRERDAARTQEDRLESDVDATFKAIGDEFVLLPPDGGRARTRVVKSPRLRGTLPIGRQRHPRFIPAFAGMSRLCIGWRECQLTLMFQKRSEPIRRLNMGIIYFSPLTIAGESDTLFPSTREIRK